MSIDGYIAKKDGNIDWLGYGHTGEEDYGFPAFISSVDALILGRNTYDVVSGFEKWPYEGKRVIVLSNQLTEVRKEAELYSGSLPELLNQLHEEGISHIWIDGGKTVTKFLEEGLVDEVTVSIISLFLGDGIPLFSTMSCGTNCHLISHKSYPSGLLQIKYKVLDLNNL